jgi:hypothetical protein
MCRFTVGMGGEGPYTTGAFANLDSGGSLLPGLPAGCGCRLALPVGTKAETAFASTLGGEEVTAEVGMETRYCPC